MNHDRDSLWNTRECSRVLPRGCSSVSVSCGSQVLGLQVFCASCLHAYKATSQAGRIVHSCPVAFQLHTHLLFANRKSENDYWSHPLFPDLTRHDGRYAGIVNHICFLFLEEVRLYKIKQHCVCVCARVLNHSVMSNSWQPHGL